MSRRQADVVTISTPSDVIFATSQLLGFIPTDSVVVLCTHSPRTRLGLAMRFDLALAEDPAALAQSIDERAQHEGADGVFVVVFSEQMPRGGVFPHAELVGELMEVMGDQILEVMLASPTRWWSYLCGDSRCCPPEGAPIDPRSPGATALAAAYALAGQAVLPDRDAVVASIAYDPMLADEAVMHDLIDEARIRHQHQRQPERQRAVRELLTSLGPTLADPRGAISDEVAAELTALCDDVVVRDEVLVRARKPRRRQSLLRLLSEVARRIPPPDDAPICATLAWIAYANGNGVLANVALDRALATDPTYSLAHLIADSLERQVPPWVLEEVMRGAARDLRGRSEAR